jgi:DNA excision repair protein ERCC-6
MSKHKKLLTVAEVAQYLEEMDSDCEEVDVAILPPSEDGNVTEEEEINEENLEEVILGDVCGEIVVSHQEPETDTNGQISAPKNRKETLNWRKNKEFDKIIESSKLEKLSETHPELINLSPFELFQKFITFEYMEEMAHQTKVYAMQKGVEYDINSKEIGQFLGLLLFSGYHSVPNEKLYWSTSEDMNIEIVQQTMSRNNFFKIKQFFHLMDNTTIKSGDKLAKISPFYEYLIERSTQFGVFHEVLSIDESMVPYYGNHSCKMFIRGKPIRFGYKVWMICSSNGYPYNMQIYCGKEAEDSGPLGSRVIN